MKKIVRLTENDITRIVKRVINEEGVVNPAASKPVQPQSTPQNKNMSSDVKTLIDYINSNQSLLQRLNNVSNNQEVIDFFNFIINKINPKVLNVNRQNLKNIIDNRFLPK